MRIESNGYTVKDIFGPNGGSIHISANGDMFTMLDSVVTKAERVTLTGKEFDLLLEAMIAAKRKADQLREMLKHDEPATATAPTAPITGYIGKPIDSAVMLDNLAGWIEGAKENHEASEHHDEVQPCWSRFYTSDIRAMIADAERETAERSAHKATA